MTDSSPSRRILSLVVTHECNLNCAYCYESYKSKKSMPFDLAIEILHREFSMAAKSDDFDELVIDFMGGEPMMQFALIRKIAEWIWKNPPEKKFTLFTTSNGTLFSDDIKQWFRDNAYRFSVGLSFDGTSVMQQSNRGCAFNDIDVDFFLETWPDQTIKMTVSCETISSLAEGIIFLQNKGLKVHANLGFGLPWDAPGILDLFSEQLRILGDYYFEHSETKSVTLLDLKIEFVLNHNHPPKKWCGTGTNMVTYDVDGRYYPCQMFTPLVLTEKQISELENIDVNNAKLLEDPKCKECCGRLLCPTCYGFNYKLTGNPAIRDELMCSLFKVQLLENCRFQMEKLRRKAGDFSRDDYMKAKSILKIHESLLS